MHTHIANKDSLALLSSPGGAVREGIWRSGGRRRAFKASTTASISTPAPVTKPTTTTVAAPAEAAAKTSSHTATIAAPAAEAHASCTSIAVLADLKHSALPVVAVELLDSVTGIIWAFKHDNA